MAHDDAPDEHAEGASRPAPVPGPPGTPSPAVARPGAPIDVGGPREVDTADALIDDAPTTGDSTIDAVVAELARARGGPLEEHIAAGEKAHRVLQARLSDLGGE